MLELEVGGSRWGIAYLVADSRLSERDRRDLFINAIEMSLYDEDERKVGGEGYEYEGIIHTEGKKQLLGVFFGKRFDGEIDTNYGKSKLRFLIKEHINPNLN